MIYEWKRGYPAPPANAQLVGERLEKLRRHNAGRLTPKIVVEDAGSDRSPLHQCFEWDNQKAAEQYRYNQAREILRHVVVQFDERPDPVRAFVCVREENEDGKMTRSYTSIGVAMEDDDLRGQVIGHALSELKSWRERYDQYRELAKLFMVIDKQLPLLEEKVA